MKNIVIACVCALAKDESIADKIIETCPEIKRSALSIRENGMRLKNGMVTRDFNLAVSILNHYIPELNNFVKTSGLTEKMEEYARIYEEEKRQAIEMARASKLNTPSIVEQAKSAVTAVAKFAKSGLEITAPEILENRLEICKGCEWWDGAALNNSGRCKKCGCSTWAKLRMASEKCPLDKWGPVNAESVN